MPLHMVLALKVYMALIGFCDHFKVFKYILP